MLPNTPQQRDRGEYNNKTASETREKGSGWNRCATFSSKHHFTKRNERQQD